MLWVSATVSGKVQVATPSLFSGAASHPPVSKKENTATVPVGTSPPSPVTLTVTVMSSPELEGSGDMLVISVVECSMNTVITSVSSSMTPPAVAVMVLFPATVELKVKTALPA